MIENKTYFIDLINSTKANQMTELYHYSGVGFKKALINLGVYRKDNALLVGVLQWGISAQESIRLDKYVKEPIKKEEYLELNRFSMADSEGKNAESQAISLGIKWIKENRPDIKLLVSYAGRKEGNYGYIYQATNWEYLGYFVSPGFWLLDGQEKHAITLWGNYDRHKENEEQSFNDWLCSNYSDIRQTWTKQFIYIQRLDKKLTPATPFLPYPKPATDSPIKIKEKIIKENNEIYNNPPLKEKKKIEYYYNKDDILFTRKTLIRRGEITAEIYKTVQYNNFGRLEKVYDSAAAAAKQNPDFTAEGIRSAIKTFKQYKNKYFKKFLYNEEIPEEIDVPFIAIVDDIPFASLSDLGRYLQVSRQAVHQAKNKKSKKIANKEIIWNLD